MDLTETSQQLLYNTAFKKQAMHYIYFAEVKNI